MSTEVYCTLQVEGIHNWPACPHEEVAYLRDPHRHIFHIKAYKPVTHSDRDTEFIILKHAIARYIHSKYWDTTQQLHLFSHRSCEMIAEELSIMFDLSKVEVSEDGENGCIFTRD